MVTVTCGSGDARKEPRRSTPQDSSLEVLQVSPSDGERCGIAFFARDLATELAGVGVRVSTMRSVRDAVRIPAPDLVLVHHHDELLTSEDVGELRRAVDGPLVLLAHAPGSEAFLDTVDGLVTMVPGSHPHSDRPVLSIVHPAWTPAELVPRRHLLAQPDTPSDIRKVGTTGFLKFDRQLVEVVSALLPRAVELDWRISVHTSPWRVESPGVLERLGELRVATPRHVVHEHRYLPHEVLNQRFQACDLLWCWTREPSSAYASGVASCLYASGSRMVVADKLQHHHVLELPNVVRAPPASMASSMPWSPRWSAEAHRDTTRVRSHGNDRLRKLGPFCVRSSTSTMHGGPTAKSHDAVVKRGGEVAPSGSGKEAGGSVVDSGF